MNKIIIIGSPGSGKSTFARKLRDKTGLPLYYLDKIWHKVDRTHISRAEFDTQLNTIIQTSNWIIDGNYQRTLEMRIAACDSVFLFDLPIKTCLAGARARVGIIREEMPWHEIKLDHFLHNKIIEFPKNELPIIDKLLQQYHTEKRIIIFHSHQDSELYLHDNFNIKNQF